MDYSFVLLSARARPESFAEFGLEGRGGGVFVRGFPLEGTGLRAELTVDLGGRTVSAEVFDEDTGEKYALFDSPRSRGSFVADLRGRVGSVVEDFRRTCLVSEDVRGRFVEFVGRRFGVSADFPWGGEDYAVFRRGGGKWFALVMKIRWRQLSVPGDEEVWVVNLKADPGKIPSLVDRRSVFPAYHMNKRHWITVLLTAAADFGALCELTEESFALVGEKPRRA